MVPRRRPQPRLEPVALPLPAAGVPVRGPAGGERPPRQARPGVRAARHRCVRRRPVLDRRGPLREGRPDRPADDRARSPTRVRSADTLHVLPTVWFRNTWSWDLGAAAPVLAATGADDGRGRRTRSWATWSSLRGPGPDGTAPTLLFCDNETNTNRLYGQPGTAFPKDGINDHVVAGAATVNPDLAGTKCAAWYQVAVEPGANVELRLRLRPGGPAPADAGRRTSTQVRDARRAEADEFYAELTPAARLGRRGDGDAPGVRRDAVEQAALLLRRGPLARRRPRPAAAAGVAADGAQRTLAQLQRLRHHVDAGQVGVPLVRRLGPGVPLRRARARRPRLRQVPAAAAVPGVVPAPRTARCPPTSGTSATSTRRSRPGRRWRCSPSTGPATSTSCRGCSTSCWSTSPGGSTCEDADGSNLFEGGFLGLDNIGPLDRSHLPVGAACSSSPTPPAGWPPTRWPWASIAMILQPRRGSGRPTIWC